MFLVRYSIYSKSYFFKISELFPFCQKNANMMGMQATRENGSDTKIETLVLFG